LDQKSFLPFKKKKKKERKESNATTASGAPNPNAQEEPKNALRPNFMLHPCDPIAL